MKKLEEETFFNDKLFKIICEKSLKIEISDYKIIRCYSNGQTANQNRTTHSDDDNPNTFTIVYFPNLEWDLRWNGALFF